jgi:sigma-B regulation protein RsbU (phosphoserine phosphatase)
MRIAIDYGDLYEHAACGMLTYKADGTILHANQTLLNWTGITEAEVEDKKVPDLLFKSGRLYYSIFIQPLLALHNEVSEVNLELQTPFGGLPVLFSAITRKLDGGGEDVINAVIFKMADRKKYESELLLQKNQLQDENMIQNMVLQEMAHNQSHLVRAPLASIIGLVDLFEEGDQSEGNAAIIRMLKISANKLDEVITGLVAMADNKKDK